MLAVLVGCWLLGADWLACCHLSLVRLLCLQHSSRKPPQTVQEIKEKFAYVALDIKKERKLAEETTVLVEKCVQRSGGDARDAIRAAFRATPPPFRPLFGKCRLAGTRCRTAA